MISLDSLQGVVQDLQCRLGGGGGLGSDPCFEEARVTRGPGALSFKEQEDVLSFN